MFRADHATRSVDLFGSGKDGYSSGDPGVTPATLVTADAINSWQEEIANAVEGAGITLDKTQRDQLLAAVNALGLQGAPKNAIEAAGMTFDDSIAAQLAEVLAFDSFVRAVSNAPPRDSSFSATSESLACAAANASGTVVAAGANGAIVTLAKNSNVCVARTAGSAYANIFAGAAWGSISGFLLVGEGEEIQQSSSGGTWNQRHTGAHNLKSVAVGSAVAVAVGLSQTILSSPDGTTWTSRTGALGSNGIYGVAWNGTRFVAAGDGGLQYSANGTSWTATGITNNFVDVVWCAARSKFIALGSTVYESADGISWSTPGAGFGNGNSKAFVSGSNVAQFNWSGQNDLTVLSRGRDPIAPIIAQGLKWRAMATQIQDNNSQGIVLVGDGGIAAYVPIVFVI
jgi:hypothetical protein